MVIALVGAIASLAIAVVSVYNHTHGNQPEEAGKNVTRIRQSTSVVLAIGNAIHAILDALALINRGGSQIKAAMQQGGSQVVPRFGGQTASDVS